MGEKKQKAEPANERDLPLAVKRQSKRPSIIKKTRYRRKTFDEGTSLAQLEDNSKRYAIPEKIIRLCTEIAKRQYVNYNFKRENLEWIQEQVLRIAILLTGCLERQMITDADIDKATTPDNVFQLLKKALGIEQYQVMIDNSTLKQRVLKLAQESTNWAAISEFRYRVFIPATIPQPCLAYLDKYQAALKSLKYRVRLFEIVETNVPKKDRGHFIGIKKGFEDDKKTLYYSLRAIISNLVLLTYFQARTEKKTIDDFIELKDYCRSNFEEFKTRFRETLHSFIQPEAFADGILALPEVVASLKKLEDHAKKGTVNKFLYFFGADPEIRKLNYKLSKVVIEVGRWCYLRKVQELPSDPVDFVSPSLAKAANDEYLEFLDEYPWFAKFLSRLEIVRYLVAETDDERKAIILGYVNQERLGEAQQLLEKQVTIGGMLKHFLASSSDQQESLEISELIAELSRKSLGRLAKDRHIRRAQLYIDRLLTKWSDTAVIDAILDFELPDYVVQLFPVSYQHYLWYVYQFNLLGRTDWKPPFPYPQGVLEHVTPVDVDRYVKNRDDHKKTREMKREAEDNISGGSKNDTITITEESDDNEEFNDFQTIETEVVDDMRTPGSDEITEEEILDGKT
jgi:hypothetical protein